ncbi:MAG TPA: hypothetical protein P5181_06185 [Dermatophilaceae bacterium]|nr:hypothetical protein [Dermatophilaceae bacterium]
MTTRRAVLGSGLLFAVAALAGCSGAGRPDTAAVVGDRVITIDELATATQQLRQFQQQSADQMAGGKAAPVRLLPEGIVLQLLVLHDALVPALRARGWTPPQVVADVLAMISRPTDATVRAITASAAVEASSSPAFGADGLDEVQRALANTRIVVNPRYGELNVRDLTSLQEFRLTETRPDWIRPAAQPTAV